MTDRIRPSPLLRRAIPLLEFPTVVVAKLCAWLILPMTGSLVYEVVSRYIFDKSYCTSRAMPHRRKSAT